MRRKNYYQRIVAEEHYNRAMQAMQEHVDISHRKIKLRNEIRKERPKYFRRKTWDEAIERVLIFIKNHKNNFRNGKLFV